MRQWTIPQILFAKCFLYLPGIGGATVNGSFVRDATHRGVIIAHLSQPKERKKNAAVNKQCAGNPTLSFLAVCHNQSHFQVQFQIEILVNMERVAYIRQCVGDSKHVMLINSFSSDCSSYFLY